MFWQLNFSSLTNTYISPFGLIQFNLVTAMQSVCQGVIFYIKHPISMECLIATFQRFLSQNLCIYFLFHLI